MKSITLTFIMGLAVLNNAYAADIESLFSDVAEKITKFKTCDLDKVWPGYSWDNKFDAFMFSSQLNERTFIWDYNHSIEIPFEYDQTPSFAYSRYSHSVSDIDGKDYVSFNFDNVRENKLRSAEYILSLLFHENFHYFGQTEILIRNRVPRGNIYPYSAKPRVYRAMVNYYLLEALKNTENKKVLLQKAKYWNEKHKSEFLKDYISTSNMDLREGSAEYAQVASLMMAYNNCKITKASIEDVMLRSGDTNNKYTRIRSDKDGQSYLSGLYAYMIDSYLFENSKGLKKNATKGLFPIELLLEDSLVLENEMQLLVSDKVESDYKYINEEAEKVINTFQAKDENSYIVSFSSDIRSVGSFTVSSFINTDEEIYPYNSIMESFYGDFHTDSLEMKFDGIHLFETSKNNCGDNQTMFILKSKPKIGSDEISIDSEKIKVLSIKHKVKDQFICLF
jgi:uncharacterized protein YdaT